MSIFYLFTKVSQAVGRITPVIQLPIVSELVKVARRDNIARDSAKVSSLGAVATSLLSKYSYDLEYMEELEGLDGKGPSQKYLEAMKTNWVQDQLRKNKKVTIPTSVDTIDKFIEYISKTGSVMSPLLSHLEQRRSERAKFMSKEDLASLEKKVRTAKGLPEGAHYITLPHGRKGVVRTEEGKSHLATILDARMRPPGRDISSKIKTAAEKLRLYHGSPHDLETLEPRQPNKGTWGDHGLYGTTNPLVAALYAIARNESPGAWGVLPDGRLIAKSKKEFNPEGYVYEYDSEDYIPPPEGDPGIGYASQSIPTILSKKRVSLDELRDNIIRVDDRDKFLEYFKKTSSPRLRTTIFGVDQGGNLLHGFGDQGFYKFPGGGVDAGESIIDAAKRELLEEAGYDVESIEELSGLDTSDSVGATSAKGHLGHGSSLTKYLLARLGKRNESLLGSEGDAIGNLQTAPIDQVLRGLEGDMLFGSGVAASNHAALRRVRDMLQKTSSEQPLYRHRSTLLIRDPVTGKLLAAKAPPDSKASPFYFPGGGLYDDEYDTPRNPSYEDIIGGARREALEELGIELVNPRVVGSHAQELEDWWKEKILRDRGVPYVGGHEHYVLADKGKEDRSLYNVEGDAFQQGDYYDPKEIVEALSRAVKSDSAFAPFNREQVRAIKDNLLKKNASDLSVKEHLRHLLVKQASLDSDFKPDLSPDDLRALGVYDQVYGDAPSEASMKEWPAHWINPQDPLGWLQWYERYSGGRRTEDDERQIKRWKSFKARHASQYLKNPTPRRAAALRNWGIDVEKLHEL